ncbi:hypothetical protein [Spirillospora sp. NPDC047279]|uniref:hypothetical protein n=1 Tax=Spirillospora sp. NPDC047279 TaxID=3155478 RepID=UPI0033C11F85
MKNIKLCGARKRKRVIAVAAAALAVPFLGVTATSAPAEAAACSGKTYWRVSVPEAHADGYKYRCGSTTHVDGYVYDDKCDSRSGVVRVEFVNGSGWVTDRDWAEAGGGCGSHSGFSMTGSGSSIRVCVYAANANGQSAMKCGWA